MVDGRKAIDREIEDDDLSLATEINPAHDIDDLNRAAIPGRNLRTHAAATKPVWLFPNRT
jgi:hypothetical protein